MKKLFFFGLLILSLVCFSQEDSSKTRFVSGGLESMEILTENTDFLATTFGYSLQLNRHHFSGGLIFGNIKYYNTNGNWEHHPFSFSLRGFHLTYSFVNKRSNKKAMTFYPFIHNNFLFYTSERGPFSEGASNTTIENIIGYGFKVKIIGGLSIHQRIGAGVANSFTILYPDKKIRKFNGSYLFSLGIQFRFRK